MWAFCRVGHFAISFCTHHCCAGVAGCPVWPQLIIYSMSSLLGYAFLVLINFKQQAFNSHRQMSHSPFNGLNSHPSVIIFTSELENLSIALISSPEVTTLKGCNWLSGSHASYFEWCLVFQESSTFTGSLLRIC